MTTKFNWNCPYCNKEATITDSNYSVDLHRFDEDNKDGLSVIVTKVIICPSDECKEYEIKCSLHSGYYYNSGFRIKPDSKRLEWNLKPNSLAKQFPSFIPQAIIADYEEACLIKTLSPKASATLSRRCLQGIIRDFFGIKKDRLVDEIKGIQDKVDPTTWKAIDAVRSIGNIGAHMEKDINLIIDVDPEEAQLLIDLIEILIKDWYISRYEREENFKSIIGVANAKAADKKSKK